MMQLNGRIAETNYRSSSAKQTPLSAVEMSSISVSGFSCGCSESTLKTVEHVVV